MNKILSIAICLLVLLSACVPLTPASAPTSASLPKPTRTAPPPTPTNAPTVTLMPALTLAPTPACFANFNPLGFSADGRALLGISTVDGQAGIWLQAFDLQTQVMRTIRRQEQGITAAALAPDGQSVAWGLPDFSIQQVSAQDGDPLASYTGHTGQVNALVFAPDGSRLYSASSDRAVIAWNTANQQAAQRFEPPGVDIPTEEIGLGISPDGKTLVTIPFEGSAKGWDTATFTKIGEYPGAISGAYNGAAASFSADGQYMAVMLAGGPGTASLWSLADGQKLWSGGFMADTAFSPDSRLFASTEVDFNNRPSTIALRTADGQTVLRSITRGSDDAVWKLLFSPDSTQLITSTGASLSFYQVEDGRLLRAYPVLCP
jgi:WD40 repeat protein